MAQNASAFLNSPIAAGRTKVQHEDNYLVSVQNSSTSLAHELPTPSNSMECNTFAPMSENLSHKQLGAYAVCGPRIQPGSRGVKRICSEWGPMMPKPQPDHSAEALGPERRLQTTKEVKHAVEGKKTRLTESDPKTGGWVRRTQG